jgi:large subunit ribosomal protein L11
MSKPIKSKVKVQLMGTMANPSQIGKELGPHGINLMKFCTEFNALTTAKKGTLCPAVITIYVDKSFSIELKTAPTSYLIKQAAKAEKGNSKPGKDAEKTITKEQAIAIAKEKLIDLNTTSLESALKSVEGTARSIGFRIK